MLNHHLHKCPFCGYKPGVYNVNTKTPELFITKCLECGLSTVKTDKDTSQKLWQKNEFSLATKQDAALYFIKKCMTHDTALRVKDI